MSRAASFVLLAILVAPIAAGQGPPPAFPAEERALLDAWAAQIDALVTPADRERPWWSDVQEFLDDAVEAKAAGRVRVAMFHLETAHELLLGNRLIDEAQGLRSDAERRTFALQRVAAQKQELERDWTAYRARLHGFDGEIRSLQTIERVLYSADIAIGAIVASAEHEALAREFPKQEGFPPGWVIALVRSTSSPRLAIGWADDLLTEAVKSEGLPPRVLDANWSELVAFSLAYGVGSDAPVVLADLEARAAPVRDNGEGMLAVAFYLAEQRGLRANSMQTIFGDASSRGLDVVADAARNMGRQLANTSVDAPASRGLLGLFTIDAIDRATLTQQYVAEGKADLGTVINAWATLEHQGYVLRALGAASPVVPPPPTPAETPLAGSVAILAIVAALLLARRRA